MNILDITIILLLMLSVVVGYKKGVFKEVVLFAGTIIVYIVAFLLKDKIGIILCKILPFFDIKGLVSLNILIYQLIAFVLIAGLLFGVLAIILKVTGILQKAADISIILSLPTKILGGVFGLINGYIVIFVILLVCSIPFRNNEIFSSSYINNKILKSTPILTDSFGKVDDVILSVIKLQEKKNSMNSINIDLLNLYLEYDIIGENDLKEIIKTGKLNYIDGIEKFK